MGINTHSRIRWLSAYDPHILREVAPAANLPAQCREIMLVSKSWCYDYRSHNTRDCDSYGHIRS